ncbi:MAG TPA: hypothetical protein VKF62_11845 [Planctomycetota bacterium]|nr:hypothetical protein [Planctomycetota bacterium]
MAPATVEEMRMARPPLLSLASILLLVSVGQAQVCPFNPSLATYGSSCGSSLTAGVASPCSIVLDTGGIYGNVGRWILVGAQPLALPFPSGTCNPLTCTLLASPDVLLPLAPAQNPLVLTIPPDPTLLGASAYLQGVGALAVGGPSPCAGFTASAGVQVTLL